jgi:acetolactate synthase-1/2/3 large subunit
MGVQQNVAEHIVTALKRHGVEVIFGQSLPSALILAAEANGIRQLAYRQENAGGAMADGYARISGKVGVVCAQNGPAATLLVPPLAEALKASIPIVALVQEVEQSQIYKNAFQELDHQRLFSSCTKWIRTLNSAERVDDFVDAAFIAATSGRPGPAVLLLPADILKQAAVKLPVVRRASYGHAPLDRPAASSEAIDAAAALIARARCPVMLCGGGVHLSGASEAVTQLQDIASLPTFTTFMGKGSVPEIHPLSCGVLGALVGPRSLGVHSRMLFQEADLILMVGTRTNANGTDSWRLIRESAQLVHIDIDPEEIGRNYEALRLMGDARETAAALAKALQSKGLSGRTASRSALETRIAGFWSAFERDRRSVSTSERTPLRPERIMRELQAGLGPDDVIVADASYSSMWILGQLRAEKAGSRFVVPRGLAGLGWGLPLAIGCQTAMPDRRVTVVVGDGGFAHSWAELETLVRHRIPVTVIVLNNGVLGFQKDAETVKFGSYTSACHFAPVNHCGIAQACGCDAEVVNETATLKQALQRARDQRRPYLIDVRTDPSAFPPLSLFVNLAESESAI